MTRCFPVEGVAFARRGMGLRRVRHLDTMIKFHDFYDGMLFSKVFLVFLQLIGA